MLNIPVGQNYCRFNEETLETALKTVLKMKLGDENASMSDRNDRPRFCPITGPSDGEVSVRGALVLFCV
jgi:hypothetical protein